MNIEIIPVNLRRLRLEKGFTQEQLASILGVSVQTVSRWECGNTMPDIMLLPEISRLYSVTIDDLFHEEPKAYPSYAQRLLAVYEASGRSEDFLAAEEEFSRISENNLSADDLRAWGVLYHYMMRHCASQAQRKLEMAMRHPSVTEQIYASAAQQRLVLLSELGKGHVEAEKYNHALQENPSDPRLWLLCTAAYEFSGENAAALERALEGIRRFPDNAALHIHAGDICRNLKQYEEAFSHWQKALTLDKSYLDAIYAMGFCYEELEQYDQAYYRGEGPGRQGISSRISRCIPQHRIFRDAELL